MARIRSIKPDYYSSGKQLRLSLEAAFLVPCLWVHADDEGRMVDDDLEIGVRCPRLGKVDGTIEKALAELAEKKWITRYEVGEKRYIEIHDFRDHQKVSHPAPSRIPPPKRMKTPEASRNVPESSGGIGLEGRMGREGSGEGLGPLPGPPPPKKNLRAEAERQLEALRALKARGEIQ